MEPATLSVLVFAGGIVLGALMATIMHTKLDDIRISRALDTIGIKRKEYLQLRGEVGSAYRALADITNRIDHLENDKSPQG